MLQMLTADECLFRENSLLHDRGMLQQIGMERIMVHPVVVFTTCRASGGNSFSNIIFCSIKNVKKKKTKYLQGVPPYRPFPFCLSIPQILLQIVTKTKNQPQH